LNAIWIDKALLSLLFQPTAFACFSAAKTS